MPAVRRRNAREGVATCLILHASYLAQEAFTAGDFVRQAEVAIDDVLSRGRVPVVVGGTSMYTQWLVQGRPDAPRSDPKMEAQARAMLASFQARNDWEVRGALCGGDWGLKAPAGHTPTSPFVTPAALFMQGALALLAERHPQRAAKLLPNDWYRLERALEVSLMTDAAPEAFTGVRQSSAGDKYDFRCFFLIAPREALCHVIDQR